MASTGVVLYFGKGKTFYFSPGSSMADTTFKLLVFKVYVYETSMIIHWGTQKVTSVDPWRWCHAPRWSPSLCIFMRIAGNRQLFI